MEPYLSHCFLGWCAYGCDRLLNCKLVSPSSVVRVSNEILDKKLDALLSEQFAERLHDQSAPFSVEDELVAEKYSNSIKEIDNRY